MKNLLRSIVVHDLIGSHSSSMGWFYLDKGEIKILDANNKLICCMSSDGTYNGNKTLIQCSKPISLFSGIASPDVQGAAKLGFLQLVKLPIRIQLKYSYNDCWADSYYSAWKGTISKEIEITQCLSNEINLNGTLNIVLKLPMHYNDSLAINEYVSIAVLPISKLEAAKESKSSNSHGKNIKSI